MNPSPSTSPASLRLHFLGSGSRGNATVVEYGAQRLLLDCGFGPRKLKQRLDGVGLTPDDIGAVFITHAHADHVAGVPLFARQQDFPIFATARTRAAMAWGTKARCAREQVVVGKSLRVGPFEVTAFAISHDCVEPVGYVVALPGGLRLGFATDLGEVTDEVREALRGCRALGIEANHDVELLRSGPYPWFLKQRVASPLGHLSNAQTVALLDQILDEHTGKLFLLHLSQTNNRPALAHAAVSAHLQARGLPTPLAVIAQDELATYDLSALV